MREAGSSLIEEPFAEDNGELRFGLDPLARGVAWHVNGFILNFCDSAAAFSPSSVLARRGRTLLASAS